MFLTAKNTFIFNYCPDYISERLIRILKQPLARIDYVSVADAETLDEPGKVKPLALVSLAVKIGSTRLIDNVVLE